MKVHQANSTINLLHAAGDFVDGLGVYLGLYAGNMHAYVSDDVLRDENGRGILFTFNEVQQEFSKRNKGRRYGDGTETEIVDAIKTGVYRDGDCILPSKELAHGVDAFDYLLRPDNNIYTLLNKGKLPKIVVEIKNSAPKQSWLLTSSEHPAVPSLMYRVSLTSEDCDWHHEDYYRSLVTPVRLYRHLAAAKVVYTPDG